MVKKRNWKKEFENIMMCHALVIEQAKMTKGSKIKSMKLVKEIAEKHKTWRIKRK